MKHIPAITPGMAAIALGIILVLSIGSAIAAQSYFSYLEVTEATDRCYDLGGFPEIEKSSWQMTHFECHTD
ncbi:hypothetical protein [Planococcus maritimus]|uniref:hypothetical protein n=1 Tax=Planococcus maritimus TaxID=192421 RepID=UPI00079AC51C|nr:hypothetical protein [Planococcus maritimus]KYG59777.1 hypothetical protein AY633_05935 [Planococcus maritimus]